MTDTPNLETGK